MLARFDEDCDGTVGLSETRLPGYKSHLAVPVSHMGLLVDAKELFADHAGLFFGFGRCRPVAALEMRLRSGPPLRLFRMRRTMLGTRTRSFGARFRDGRRDALSLLFGENL